MVFIPHVRKGKWRVWADHGVEFFIHPVMHAGPSVGFSGDQEGNFYVAQVDNGCVQKFKPRRGANPAYPVSKPLYAGWK